MKHNIIKYQLSNIKYTIWLISKYIFIKVQLHNFCFNQKVHTITVSIPRRVKVKSRYKVPSLSSTQFHKVFFVLFQIYLILRSF